MYYTLLDKQTIATEQTFFSNLTHYNRLYSLQRKEKGKDRLYRRGVINKEQLFCVDTWEHLF